MPRKATTMHFTVPGAPQGYYALGKFPNWKRKQRYHGWCKLVRLRAAQAGITPWRASDAN